MARGRDCEKTAVEPVQVTVPATGTTPAPEVSEKVAVVMLAGFIGALKVTLTTLLKRTLVAPLTGVVDTMVGETAATVVKVQLWLAASPVPAGFLAPVVMVAVNAVPLASGEVGWKTATALEQLTVPGTATAGEPEVTVKVMAVSEAGSIASLKVALMGAPARTLVAPLTGVVDMTVGATGVSVELPQAASEKSRNAAPTLDSMDIDFTGAPLH